MDSLLPVRTKLLALSKNDLEITLSANLYKLSKELMDSICQYPVDLSSFLYATLSNLTAEEKLAYDIYRQALRDYPAQEGFPWSVTFPKQPNK